MPKKYSIAIDGPAGVGKSTVAKALARILGYTYIDTGAMYRAVTLMAIEEKTDLSDEKALSSLAEKAVIKLIDTGKDDIKVLLNGTDVSEKIRQPLVTGHVSEVSKAAGVRKVLAGIQRAIAEKGGVVMEGRDIGTAVLPDADYKFFIIASAAERARRRAKDYREMNIPVNLDELTAEIKKRDYIDSSRAVNPLKPADDALVIDCTDMNAEEVINTIINHLTEVSV